MADKAEQARQLFLSGANCAQAVLGAFHRECGLDFDAAMRLASGFGGGMLAKLREKHVDGSTVTFTVDYYAGDDVGFTAPEYAKTYTLTFFYGRYRYESAVEAA